ncbi:hypothetical protein [Tabrizicola flagellatus]|uniref:hypothetical protein n=1 Tax=Tabrizicola flagellatus TaxID=2593021 RepID=UPI00391A92E9
MARGLEIFLAVLALGATSVPGAAGPLLRDFAVCAGRLSAVMEDQWMFDGPASERTQAELHAVVAVIEASMPEGASTQVMAWRIDAKVAQRTLLAQVRFAADRRLSQTAAARAEALAAHCQAMILS